MSNLKSGNIDLEPYAVGDTIITDSDGQNALFVGWISADATARWSEIRVPKILFEWNSQEKGELRLVVTAASRSRQDSAVLVNGTEIGSVSFGDTAETETLTFSGSLLKANDINEIAFSMPGFLIPGFGYLERPHLGFIALSIDGLGSTYD